MSPRCCGPNKVSGDVLGGLADSGRSRWMSVCFGDLRKTALLPLKHPQALNPKP